ncbi:MAG TPA: carboxylesterase family protein, partial [Sorangium sp.]|nr:carboxylesterase family protein [Sorangium sp.]
VGTLRFAPPEAHACWGGTRDATTFGAKCPQYDNSTTPPTLVGDEDCLTLNVWTPATGATATPRPVMFFIHGGGNVQGASSAQIVGGTPLYTGKHLAAAHDAVVVTVNYRLGALGFLATDELKAESDSASAGNYAIMDQLAALRWVRDNIAAFGGDAQRVLLFGESAGGGNVCSLLATPSAAGLFHAALIQSGGCLLPQMATVVGRHNMLVDNSSCGAAADRLACLRELDVDTLLGEFPGSISGVFDASLEGVGVGYGPLVDGKLITQSPLAAMTAGTHNQVPIVFGTNAEELAQLITTKVNTEAEYVATIEAAFMSQGQSWIDSVLAAYPAANYPDAQAALVDVFSDMRFTCLNRAYARAAAAGPQPVYRYWFSRQAETKQGPLAAAHGIELAYMFGSLSDIPLFTPAAADAALSSDMMGYWARFAASGDPNGAGAVNWPKYNNATDPVLVLDSPIVSQDNLKTAQCDMWDSFYLTQL